MLQKNSSDLPSGRALEMCLDPNNPWTYGGVEKTAGSQIQKVRLALKKDADSKHTKCHPLQLFNA